MPRLLAGNMHTVGVARFWLRPPLQRQSGRALKWVLHVALGGLPIPFRLTPRLLWGRRG